MFTTRFEAWVRRHAEALMSALQRLPVTPNQITVVGTALTFVAAVFTAFGQLRWGGVVLAFAGTFDILDGALARSTGRSYAYGAFLDSTLDRYSEGAMYLGLIAYFASAGGPLQRWLILATAAALSGSRASAKREPPSRAASPPSSKVIHRRRSFCRHRRARASPGSAPIAARLRATGACISLRRRGRPRQGDHRARPRGGAAA